VSPADAKNILGSKMGNPPGGNGWDTWAKYILLTLERLDDDIGKISVKVDEINLRSQVEISKLHQKAGIVGAIAGAVPVAIGLLIWWLQTAAKT